ncbi:hypothetical protein TruAng_000576 [Truncatella angustata]|nr:hypothetical protein TruAng_000576 [Truncatella angustata]
MDTPTDGTLKGKHRDFRWYHLSANNMEWVEHLTIRHMSEIYPSFKALSSDFKELAGLSDTRDRYHNTTTGRSSFSKSRCRPFQVGNIQSLVFTPATDREMDADGARWGSVRRSPDRGLQLSGKTSPPVDDPSAWAAKDPVTLLKHLVDGYLTSASPNKTPPLQLRRSLDQYFFTHLDTTRRDKDQVTLSSAVPKFRWTIWSSQMQHHHRRKPKRWIPKFQNHKDILYLQRRQILNISFHRLCGLSNRRQIPMYIVLLTQKVGFVIGAHVHGSMNSRIRSIVTNHTRPSDHGQLGVEEDIYTAAGQRSRGRSGGHLEEKRQPLSSFGQLSVSAGKRNPEPLRQCLRSSQNPPEYRFFDFFESSIGYASDRAATLLENFRRAATSDMEDMEDNDYHTKFSIQKEARLLVEIEDIREELNILRVVLEDQSNKFEDMFDISEHQLYDDCLSVKDNRLLASHLQWIGTMEKMAKKTSKALPLSFMAAFFAINIDVFPVNENGKLSLDHVLRNMLGVSAGLSVPFILIAFNQEIMIKWNRAVRKELSVRFITITFFVPSMITVILSVLWFSYVDTSMKTGITVMVVLLTAGGYVGFGVYKLVHLARQQVGTVTEPSSGNESANNYDDD